MYSEYTDYISSFVHTPITEWTFKSNPSYCNILEHISPDIGGKYLMEIDRRFGQIFNEHKKYFIELCKTNDLYGNTRKFSFNNFTICSPSNLRYILHGLLILSYMKQ